MFALAVADTAICVCGSHLSLEVTHFVAVVLFSLVIVTVVTFSVCLSIERLIAVRRPHTFDMNPKLAKTYHMVLPISAIPLVAVNRLAKYMRYVKLIAFMRMCFLTASSVLSQAGRWHQHGTRQLKL